MVSTLQNYCFFSFCSSQEYISDLFHYLHNSADSPQVLALLEGFLFSVIRDVKHFSSENQRLEDALKRFVNLLIKHDIIDPCILELL